MAQSRRTCHLIFRRNWVNISEMGEPRLVSRVKFVAQKGSHTIFVSKINKENESFNELPTQHFRRFPSRNGSGGNNLSATITAVGGTSRRSLISETFHCVTDVRVINLPTLRSQIASKSFGFPWQRLQLK